MTSQARVTNSHAPTGNIIRDSALGLVPETLGNYMDLNRQLWEGGPLSPAEIEIARIRNARKVNCVFCKSVRYDIAQEDGLSEDRVQMIDDDYEQSNLTDREKLILAFTDQYLNDPAGLDSALKERLRQVFTPQELVHLSMVVAFFNGFSRCAVAIGGMPDELPVMTISVPQ
ncbi:carboxymuconolactone decarboxylase family protein [Parahaliea mediterranea]|uniref:Carboxymuconolactone decarboxylase family protein n=1 Tax=Parahaliea mediterranea TaxID=651086 RepID=A0A939IIA0_9GAMM|nr:carboxymuconolactone decarboxylase family protein [Parahaliea mediterranea]MBN7796379.1 carboxymuconolactone decarboxylase family protein [Parahaliea mediterranea]